MKRVHSTRHHLDIQEMPIIVDIRRSVLVSGAPLIPTNKCIHRVDEMGGVAACSTFGRLVGNLLTYSEALFVCAYCMGSVHAMPMADCVDHYPDTP